MTPIELKEWADAAAPIIDRILLVIAGVALLWLLSRVAWRDFFAWLAAPTMGSLIFVGSFCLAAQSLLSQESVYKYWNPYLLEFAKFIFGSFGAGFIALKAYRMKPEPDAAKADPPG